MATLAVGFRKRLVFAQEKSLRLNGGLVPVPWAQVLWQDVQCHLCTCDVGRPRLSRLEAGGLAWGTSMEVRCAGRSELSANSRLIYDGIHCVGRQT